MGKIERYHRTMKNVIRLEHYYSPEELENQIAAFVGHYNNYRYCGSTGTDRLQFTVVCCRLVTDRFWYCARYLLSVDGT